jgi:hypothetical protein
MMRCGGSSSARLHGGHELGEAVAERGVRLGERSAARGIRGVEHAAVGKHSAQVAQRVVRVLAHAAAHAAAVVRDHAADHAAVDRRGVRADLVLHRGLVALVVRGEDAVDLAADEARLDGDGAAVALHAAAAPRSAARALVAAPAWRRVPVACAKYWWSTQYIALDTSMGASRVQRIAGLPRCDQRQILPGPCWCAVCPIASAPQRRLQRHADKPKKRTWTV